MVEEETEVCWPRASSPARLRAMAAQIEVAEQIDPEFHAELVHAALLLTPGDRERLLRELGPSRRPRLPASTGRDDPSPTAIRPAFEPQ